MDGYKNHAFQKLAASLLYLSFGMAMWNISFGIGSYDLNSTIGRPEFLPLWPRHPLLPNIATFGFAALLMVSVLLKRRLQLGLLCLHFTILLVWWGLVLHGEFSGNIRFALPGLICWGFFFWVLLRGDRF